MISNGTIHERMCIAKEEDSVRYVWYVVVLLALVNTFNYIDRMALAVLAPLIKTDLGLSDTKIGVLTGFAFAVFYAVCGIPIARWADRGNRRNITAIAVATWSTMTALSGAAQGFWQLLGARVGVGAGEAGGLAPAQSMICDYVPLSRRSSAFAIHTFGIFLGIMLGMALAGWVAQSVGWRLTFVILGVPGLVLAIVVRLTLREPRRGALDAVKQDEPVSPLGATLKALWRCRTYRYLLYFAIVNGFVQYGLNQWWPSFYVRSFGLDVVTVGFYLGTAIGIGSAIGLLMGGLIADRAVRHDPRLPLFIGAGAITLAIPVTLGSLFVPSALLSILLVSLTALLWNVPAGPAIALGYSVVSPKTRAVSGAFNIFATALLGFGLGPLCVGLLSDRLSSSLGAEGLRYALLVPVALLPFMAIALYAGARVIQSDLMASVVPSTSTESPPTAPSVACSS